MNTRKRAFPAEGTSATVLRLGCVWHVWVPEQSGARGNGLSKSEWGGRWGKSAFHVCTLYSPAAPSTGDTLLAGSLQETGCSPPVAKWRAQLQNQKLSGAIDRVSACRGKSKSALLWGPRQSRLVLGSQRKPGFLSAGSPCPTESPPACPGEMGLLGETGALAESAQRNLPLCVACGHDGVPGLNRHQQGYRSNLYHLK